MQNIVLKRIQKAKTKEDIDRIINNRLEYLNFFSIKDQVIGINVDINPKKDIYKGNYDEDLTEPAYLVWDDYIPLGTKVVYGTWEVYDTGESINAGSYYYVDDESYIEEFVNSIKNEYVPDLETLINYIHGYLCMKLEKKVNQSDRLEIHKLILKNEEEFLRPAKEHSIKDLYYNGSALCTEYSVMGQNILSFFDIKVKLLLTGNHCFQMVNRDGMYYILDFSKTVGVLDEQLKMFNKVPFFKAYGYLPESWFEEFCYGKEEIRIREYFIQKIYNRFYMMQMNKDRVYKSIMGAERKDNDDERIVRTLKKL